MPTQRFLKLKEEKKQMILEAAAHEFSRVPYSSASINQIIKEADISRGSFYTYFEDKDDLMRYMLRGFRVSCGKTVLDTLKSQKGDPFETSLELLSTVLKKDQNGMGYRMYRNMLSDLSVVNQNQMFGVKGFLVQDEAYRSFIEQLYECLDHEQYPIDQDTLAYLVDMLVLIFIRSVTLFYAGAAESGRILEVMKNEMGILEAGIRSCKNNRT